MHLEVLKSEQKRVFKGLNQFPGFYLVGGTALALQMGHRFSVDFDLFSGNKLSSALLSKVRRVFGRDNKEKQTTLEEVIKIANKKYKDEFNLRLLLEQLIYLEDIKKEKIEFIKPKPTEKQMLKFFEEQIAKIEL